MKEELITEKKQINSAFKKVQQKIPGGNTLIQVI